MNYFEDAQTHVRGQSIYIDDMPNIEGTLYSMMFESPIAHGTIKSIHYDKARALPGVAGIFTADDVLGVNEIGLVIGDEPFLAKKDLHFIGQPIAIIVADSEMIARKAYALIEIEVNEKPAVVDPRESYKNKTFISSPRTFSIGNTDTQWDQCAHVFEGQTKCCGQEHLYLEPQSAYAVPKENNCMKVYSSTQGPTLVQTVVARILNMPMHSVEVNTLRLGGGFGGKEDQANPWAAGSALAAHILKRPVKMILHRLADMRMTGKRHPYQADFKIGLDKDLKIIAYEADFFQNSGASMDLSPAVLARSLFHASNCYNLPHARISAYSCRTNIQPHTAFRGFGAPQGMLVIEAAIATAAEKLKISAHDIQRKNLLVDGDEFPYGQKVKDCHAVLAWDKTEEIYDTKKLHTDIEHFNKTHKTLKKGISYMPVCFGISYTKISFNQARALVHVYLDGSIGITTGAIEMGQGVNAKIRHVATHVFCVKPERIKFEAANTTRVANSSATSASCAADLNGHALRIGATKIRDRLMHVAAKLLKIKNTRDLRLKDEWVYHDGKKTEISWEQLISEAYAMRTNLSEVGHYATPKIHYDDKKEKGAPYAYHVYGTAITVVTVDCIRGTYEFDAVKIVHDTGKSIDKNIDLGQIEGGLVQGMGWMTLEELAYSDTGKLLSNSLSTYKIPDIYFVPKTLETHLLDVEGPHAAILGSKAVGEPPLMYGIGAYFAIVNAIKAYNPTYQIKFDSPMTHEKVLMGLYA